MKGVFGSNPLLWLIPFYPNYKGSGLLFEVRDELKAQVLYKAM
jgi:hypothetical protein